MGKMEDKKMTISLVFGQDFVKVWYSGCYKTRKNIAMEFLFHAGVIRNGCLCNSDFTGMKLHLLRENFFFLPEKYNKQGAWQAYRKIASKEKAPDK